jgi:hypothetical protein
MSVVSGRPIVRILLLLSLAVWAPATAQRERGGEESDPTEQLGQLPQDFDIEFDGQAKQTEEGDYLFTDSVTISARDSRIQADRLSLRQGRYIEAEGNILIVWQGNRIYGTRLTYDLETERGSIENAMGQVQSEFIFWAKLAEKIGDDKIRVKSATVTTCTQPVPYWSFAVTSATITINKYARMWNALFRADRVPLLYAPYMVWPVKRERAAGLLFPEFASTQQRGRAISQPLFIPLGRSADLTLVGRYYTEAGFGGGGELRFIPNRQGSAVLNGFVINDEVTDEIRYRASYRQTQNFRNGFRMVADVNAVSDFDFYSDFERDLGLVSTPQILTRLEFSRNGPWTSMNIRELRREQLFSDESSLIQQTLPEIELRGRSRKLGKTWFYLDYQASMASIQQRRKAGATGVPPTEPASDYLRADLFPSISMPLSRYPWINVTPRVSYRVTSYTQHQGPDPDSLGTVIIDENLTRSLFAAGLEVVGPKIFRFFPRSAGPNDKRYRNIIEPRLSYRFGEGFDRQEEIILYDEVDRVGGAGNLASYGITTRLFAQRPRADPTPPPRTGETIVLPDGTTSEPTGLSPFQEPSGLSQRGLASEGLGVAGLGLLGASGPPESLEIASLELRQARSFDSILSTADLDGDGLRETTSGLSSVQLVGRYNPTPLTSLDLRSDYDILYNAIDNVSVSGSVRSRIANVRFSLVHRNPLDPRPITAEERETTTVKRLFVEADEDTQLRLTTGFNLLRNRLRLDINGTYVVNPGPEQPHVPDLRWRLQYSTQCCTVIVERLTRQFVGLDDRNDTYFRIDLRGIGKILRFSY